MRKIVLTDIEKIECLEVPIPEVKPGWVRVKLLRCGICGTDVHTYYEESIFGKDVFPFNIGHETAGVVDAIGAGVLNVEAGDPAVINPFWACGACQSCHMGYPNNCEHKTTIGLTGPSGNSEYTLAPAASVVKVEKDIDPTYLAFTEPAANVIYALDKLRFDATKDVLVVGAGAIGLLFVQLLKNTNIKSLTVADVVDEKLEIAKKLGVESTINPIKENSDRKYDVIIDCTGVAKVAENNLKMVKFGAQVMIFGVCPIDSDMVVKPFDLYSNDVSLYFSFALTAATFRKALNLIENGRLDVAPLVAGVYPVGQLEHCIQRIKKGEVVGKIIIDCTRY